MKSIEMIKVRSFSVLEKQKALEIFLTISIRDQKKLLKMSLLQDQNMVTDFIACLYWQEAGIKKHSDISDKLIAALKKYGWISHSVWEPLSGITILNRETN